ncbi:hypothetical protein, partial [Enterococcus faecalis]|uniref:hypothetical protein n=1 Tax=Enterococcus faecalis TaxID=1351 RepID=UPI001F3F6F8E
PPLHTVREPFTSYGVPSIYFLLNVLQITHFSIKVDFCYLLWQQFQFIDVVIDYHFICGMNQKMDILMNNSQVIKFVVSTKTFW